MVCACLMAALISATPWRTKFTSEFRVDPTATDYVAAVSWKPWTDEPPTGPVVLDLYELDSNKRKLITSTVVDLSVEVKQIQLHRIPGTMNGSKKTFDTWFLTTAVNGGQFDSLLVWHFDPFTKRPRQVLSVLMGDDSRLDRGIVVENSFARYAEGKLPKGVTDGPTNIKRTWRYDRTSGRFVAGKWRRS